MSKTHPARRLLTVAAATAVLALSLSGCSTDVSRSASADNAPAATKLSTIHTTCSGVKVVIEYGALNQTPEATCVPLTGTESVSSVLSRAGIKVDGTPKYGDAMVCRLNGYPAAEKPVTVTGKPNYTESCADSTPMTYYWFMYLKDSATGTWAPAEKGVKDQMISAGQQVNFVYTTATELPTATN